jgi:predicted permease
VGKTSGSDCQNPGGVVTESAMSFLRNVASGLWSLFRKERVDRELDEELGTYLEMETEEKMKQGMSRKDALRAVRLERGTLEGTKEVVRSAGWESFVETLWQDLRFATRMLRKSPGFAAVAVLTLALGIGANTAIFSLINSVMLKSLPVKEPEQLVLFTRSNLQSNAMTSFPYPFYGQVRDDNTVLSGVLCQTRMAPSLSVNGSSERTSGELVSGNFFEILGIKPYIGRLITPDDDRTAGANPVVVLSHGFWRRRFGSDPSVVGTTVHLNTIPMTVIGISAPQFESLNIGESPDVRVPMTMQAEMWARPSILESRGDWWLSIIGRLKPGVTNVQAQAALQSMLIAYMDENGRGSARSEYQRRVFQSERLHLLSAAKGLQGLAQRLSKPLVVLMAVVGAVLLIASVNIANLMLARTAARKREIAVRLALGAGRDRLIRQLLTESILLAGLGGLLGIAIAYRGGIVLLSLLATGRNPVSLDLAPDARVLGFTLLVSFCTGVLFGLAPALQSARPDVVPDLKGEATLLRGTRLRGRKLLVSAQVALSLLLLVAAGLFARSLHNLRAMDTGFDREDVLQLSMDPALSGYKPERLKPFYREVAARVSALPGVRSASLANIGLISSSSWGSGITVEGYTPRDGDRGPERNTVGPGYFTTLGIPLLLGRDFGPQDSETAPHVAIINEKFAHFYFGNENPLGRRIGPGGNQGPRDYTIVGVAKDGRYAGLREETPRFWYIPYEQYDRVKGLKLYVRTVGEPNKMVATIRREIQSIDRNVPVFDVWTLDAQVEDDLVTDRLVATLSGSFSILAVVLAAIGLYGVMVYSVARRTREIGIRIALGAHQGSVLWLVLREVVLLLALGIAVAIPASLALTRFVASMLYGVQGDIVPLVGATFLTSAVALMAGYLPARRAMRVDPIVALRYE